jgi:lipoprotein NlpI/transglutaminase-like putative cysteine protease
MSRKFFVVAAFLMGLACSAEQAMAQTQRNATDTAAAKPGSTSFQIGRTPLWVSPAPSNEGGLIPAASMHNEFLDEQVQLDEKSATSYTHVTRVVDQTDGLGMASEIQVEFTPSYENLTFHTIEIWRNGVRIDKLDRNKIRVLQRETNLERQIYDGTMTAMLVLDDLRVGDRVEFAYSIKGMNPVFDGKFVQIDWMSSGRGPTKLSRYRLLAPEGRTIKYRIGPDVTVKETVHDGMRDTEFLRLSAPQIRGDQYTPASSFLDEQISLSEFPDWQSITRWGAKLNADELSKPSPLVKETLQKIGAAEAQTPAEKLRLTLDFVQNQIRYFGTEIGENSHRPSSPDKVIKQRFGDCKDKTLLLIAMLKELGIAAAPVLVSTRLRNDLEPAFSSPLLFNHVIARVELDGQVYWLDGTRQGQTGTLPQRQSYGMGKGLILRPDANSLTDLPGAENEMRVAVEETYRIKAFSEPPMLDFRMTYYGELAEMLRQAAATQPAETLEQHLNRDLIHAHPGLEKAAPMKLEDVPEQNAFRIVGSFRAPKLWRIPEEKRRLTGDYALWNLSSPLVGGDPARTQPFQNGYPGIYRHSVRLEFPEDVVTSSSSKQLHEEDNHLAMQIDLDVEPREFRMQGELRLIRDKVEVADWPTYATFLMGIEKKFAGEFSVALLPPDQMEALTQKITELVAPWKSLFGKKPPTKVQADAMVDRLVLTGFLDGGRLTPELRAEMLRKRGVAQDNLGLHELAKPDFDEALRLAPNNTGNLTDAAVNAFALGQDAKASEYANKALSLNPSALPPKGTLAYLAYYGKNYPEAKRKLLEQLKNRKSVSDGYATIWLFLAAKRNNDDAQAAVKPYLAANKSDWPHPLLQYLLGAGSWEQALKVAGEDADDPSRLCELYFYAGEKSLIEGQYAQARDFFNKSMNTGVVEYNEYLMSQRSLRLLKETGTTQ